MNYVELIQRKAEQVFGNKAKADAWLNQPKSEFSGSTPIQHAQNEAGYQQAWEMLERIDHGYSL